MSCEEVFRPAGEEEPEKMIGSAPLSASVAPLLPGGTVLNGRYIVGSGILDFFHAEYPAFDEQEKKNVTVMEYFCRKIMERQPDGSLRVLDQQKADLGRKWFDRQCDYAFWMPSGVSRLLDKFQENGTAYAVLEYQYIENLEESIEDYYYEKQNLFPGNWSAEGLLSQMKGAMSALSSLHNAGFLHSRVCNGTIRLWGAPGTMACFGYIEEYPGPRSEPIPGVYSDQERFEYMKQCWECPLEYYSSRYPVGPYSDVYVLSTVFYRWLVAFDYVPRSAAERMGEGNAHLEQYRIPDPVFAVLKKGMSLRMKDRYQSVEEFMWALRGAIYQARDAQ